MNICQAATHTLFSRLFKIHNYIAEQKESAGEQRRVETHEIIIHPGLLKFIRCHSLISICARIYRENNSRRRCHSRNFDLPRQQQAATIQKQWQHHQIEQRTREKKIEKENRMRKEIDINQV